MKKKIVILSFIGLLLAVWAFAVWNINATAEKPIVETYSMQDTVAYGENYFRRSDNIIDGYTVTVLSAEIVPYEEYAQKQGITPPERMTDETGNFLYRPEYVYDVEVRFSNTDNEEGTVDMFDTLGTLYGACRSGDLLVKNDKGEPEVPNMNKAMMADAIATCTGSVFGTSTVTTFVESSAGVAAGGKTGVTSLITSAAFAVALFFAPIAKLIPPYAYGAALVYVGVLMIGSVKEIDWKDISISVPAFLTIAMMPFTYNISYRIAFGLLSFVAIKTFCGEIKEIKAGTWVITALFFAMFFLTH